jgi:hypothetical protein
MTDLDVSWARCAPLDLVLPARSTIGWIPAYQRSSDERVIRAGLAIGGFAHRSDAVKAKTPPPLTLS